MMVIEGLLIYLSQQYSGQILGTNARTWVLATLFIDLMNEKSKVSAFFEKMSEPLIQKVSI
jgi:hypothetical protein